MTKIAATPIYGKIFKEASSPERTVLILKRTAFKLYSVCIKDDDLFHGAGSNLVSYVFEGGKLFQSQLMGTLATNDQIKSKLWFMKIF